MDNGYVFSQRPFARLFANALRDRGWRSSRSPLSDETLWYPGPTHPIGRETRRPPRLPLADAVIEELRLR